MQMPVNGVKPATLKSSSGAETRTPRGPQWADLGPTPKIEKISANPTVVDPLLAVGFTLEEAHRFLPFLFLYLFRACNQVDLKEQASKINPAVNLFPFLSRIPIMGDLTLNDKICLYAMYKGEDPGVEPNYYIKDVVKHRLVRRRLRVLSEYPSYTIQEVQALERRAICNSEIEQYMGRFIHRKMYFIVKNYGVDAEELAESLQERAIHNLRINYPRWNAYGDMLAMAKSAIANAGHNIINFYAADKRAKINTNNEAIECSLDAMLEMAGDGYEFTALVYSDVFQDGIREMETRMSVEAILRVTESAPKKHLLLRLLAGREDVGFTDFLGRDNADYAEEVPFDKLLAKACVYVGVSSERARKLFSVLNN